MLVYFDTDVYSHIESLERVTASDRDFLFRSAAGNRISIYFSDLNALELSMLLARKPERLESIARTARRLCPVRRICKGVKNVWYDDIHYYLEHQRGRRVDIRWRPRARFHRGKGDMID